MADTYTTNLNLTKPEPGAAEDTWGISLNADLDSLDAIFSSSGTQINLNPNQVNFADGKKAIFGTGNDLQIYHDGSNSYVTDVGTGNLILKGGGQILLKSPADENMIMATGNGAVNLFYDNANKFQTTSTGINVTGTAEVDVLSIGGTAITATATELNYVDGVTGSIQTQLGTKIENSDDVTLGTISSGAITSTGNSQMANLVVTGDLTVQGTTTTVNTDDLNVKDKNITLNYSTGDSSASANGAGITIQDAVSAGNDATILWNTNFDNFDFSHTIRIPDSQKVEFGADADLQIYHESGNNHSVIKETGTGNLKIQAANIEMQIPNGTQNYLQAINGGAVTLYNNGSPKIATTSSGIDVTGVITTDGLTTSADINFGDNDKAVFGAGSDLQIYHNGSASYIDDQGTGPLYLRGNTVTALNLSDVAMFTAIGGNKVGLNFNGNEKLATTPTGINVTGTVTSDGLTVSDSQAGGVTAQIQNSNPTQTGGTRLDFLYSGSTVTGRIQNRFNGGDFQTDWYTGNDGLEIFTDLAKTEKRLDIASNGDISFYDDTGSTQGLFWDASAEQLLLGITATAAGGSLVAKTDSNGYGIAIEENSGSERWSLGVDVDGDLNFLNSTDTTPTVTFNDAGNVGIGNTNPQNKLDIEQSAAISARILATGATSSSLKLEVKGGATQLTTTEILANSSGAMTFATGTTSSSESMRINSSGNVGIGTSSPSEKLTVVGETTSGSGTYGTKLTYSNGNQSGIIDTFGNHNLEFRANNDRAMNIAANGDISFYEDTGTTAKFFWDSSAEALGIGTTSPSYKLNVAGDIVSDGDGNTRTIGFDFYGALKYNLYMDGSTDADKMHIRKGTTNVATFDTSGNVGIGTTSPSKTLDVEGNIRAKNAVGNSGAEIDITSGSTWRFRSNATSGTNSYGLDIIKGSAGTDVKMSIDSSGNVGIGTSSPSFSLDVRTADNNVAQFKSTDASATVFIADNSSSSAIRNNLGVLTLSADEGDTSSGTAIVFQTDTAERARITSSGNVGIGTSSITNNTLGKTTYFGNSTSSITGDSSQARFWLGNNWYYNSGDKFIGTGYANLYSQQNGTHQFLTSTASGTAGAAVTFTTVLKIDSSGNVGIGTDNPARKLDVVGDASISTTGSSTGLRITTSTTGEGYLIFGDTVDNSMGGIAYSNSTNALTFDSNNAERMRLDSSGNLLVAQSSTTTPGTGNTTTGISLRDVGAIHASRDGNRSLYVNRNTTDGQIISVQKDGTEVGSIGVINTNNLTIGGSVSNHSGLQFGTAVITPMRAGAESDAQIDIGFSNARFKDLYLSGHLKTGGGGSNSTGEIEFVADSTRARIVGGYQSGGGGYLKFHTDTTGGSDLERMRIDSSGNVGIGTTSPSEKLHVLGNTKITGTITVGASHTIGDATATDDNLLIASADNKNLTIKAGDDSSTLRLKTTNTALTINPEGLVTIEEETTINDDLTINATTPSLNLIDTNNNSDYAVNNANGVFQIFDKTNDVSRLSVTSAGNVGIGTNSPSTKLEVAGYGKFTNSDNSPRLHITGGRDYFLTTTSNGLFGLYDNTASSYRLAVDTSGRVGIGTTSPATDLHIKNSSHTQLLIESGTTSEGIILFGDSDDLNVGSITYNHSANFMAFETADSERLRIDSSGRLGIGTSSPSEKLHVVGNAEISGNVEMATFLSTSNATVEGTFTSEGLFTTDNKATIEGNKSSASDHILQIKNKNTSNEGRYLQFTDNTGTNIGQIGHVDQTESNLFIATFSTGLKFESYITYKAILPCNENGADSDNAIDLGSSSVRFDDIYATNGTIQTSDRNQKQDIQALTDAEQRVATACKGLIRRFRWQDSVAEKDDNPDSDETARYHFGVIAQDLQDAFTAEGLDAGAYGMFISSTWTDDDGVEQTRLGVRYNELLAFIIAAI